MTALYVLRHAKSSWDDPSLPDRERPLAPRGQRAATLISRYLQESGIDPDQVLCSPARRTIETYEAVAPSGEFLVEPALYAASASALLDRLRAVPAGTASVMLIGHNPAVQDIVLELATPDPGDGRRADVARKFPTGALATLEFTCRWDELSAGRARLSDFVKPRSLAR